MIDEIQGHIASAGMLVGHNIKFDLNWLRFLDIEFDHCRIYCTQVVEYLLRAQRMGDLHLADLSKQYLSVEKIDKVKTFWDAGYETTEIPLNILLPYLEQDCINALAVYQRQMPLIVEQGMQRLAMVECETSRVLSAIECNGMRFNRQVALAEVEKLTDKLQSIDKELISLFGWPVNLGSGDDLSAALYGGVSKVEEEEWVIKTLKSRPESTYKCRMVTREVTREGAGFEPLKGTELKKEGYYQTDKGTIKQLKGKTKPQKQIKKLLISRSKLAKALSTFVGKKEGDGKGLIAKIQAGGCIHPQYNQTIAKTGRLSSKDPNGQNLPRKGTSPIKTAIIPRFDFILNYDLSQLEWRVAAFLSRDQVMINEIKSGVDAHRENAINILGADPNSKDFSEQRNIAKRITFRLLYGGSAYGFFMAPDMPRWSLKRWEYVVNGFNKKYCVLKRWQDQNTATVSHTGKLVNPTGRKFVFNKGPKGTYSKPQVCNFPVQSLATADIMPLAMAIVYKKVRDAGFESLMIGQIHDAILFDCKKDEVRELTRIVLGVYRDLPKYIESYFGFKFDVPLDGDSEYGYSYGAMKTFDLAA